MGRLYRETLSVATLTSFSQVWVLFIILSYAGVMFGLFPVQVIEGHCYMHNSKGN